LLFTFPCDHTGSPAPGIRFIQDRVAPQTSITVFEANCQSSVGVQRAV